MATRIVPVAEVEKRLGALDMARPVFRRDAVERHFLRFVRELKVFTAPPPVRWVEGTADLKRRLWNGGAGTRGVGVQNLMRSVVRQRGEALQRQIGFPEYAVVRLLASIDPQAVPVSEEYRNWVRAALLSDDDLLKAFEAGLGFWQIYDAAIVLIPRPGLRVRQERNNRAVLHSLVGPAVQFRGDPVSDQYWIRGVRVPEFAVMHPDQITREHIRRARTVEQRRTLIDQYGLLRYCLERGFKPIDRADEFGVTLYARGGNRRNIWDTSERECVVELVNSTPEPSGEHRHFARRVPSNMTTAHQAVAWTFGFANAADYRPAVQT